MEGAGCGRTGWHLHVVCVFMFVQVCDHVRLVTRMCVCECVCMCVCVRMDSIVRNPTKSYSILLPLGIA